MSQARMLLHGWFLCASLVMFVSCAAPEQSNSSSNPQVNTGLASLAANKGLDLRSDPSLPMSRDEVGAAAQRAALDIQAGLNSAAERTHTLPPPAQPAAPSPESSSEPFTTSLNAVASGSPAALPATPPIDRARLAAEADSAWDAAAAPPPLPAPTPPKPEPTSADQLVEIASRMAALLRAPVSGEHPRIPDAAALAPIESLQPGVLAQLDDPSSLLSQRLTSEDRRTLIDSRDRLAGRPSEAAKLAQSLSRITPASPLRISRVALCTRVMGYGKYNAFAGTTFVSGRPVPAIVYVEVENFSARPARENDPALSGAALSEQVSVELAQSLTLYQDPSGLQAWHRPAQSIIETSRTQRRDFYLIQQIELPRSLSIGRYNLKITVKDKTSGQEAEGVIPITIVAGA